MKNEDLFKQYASNINAGTSNNFILKFEDNDTYTFRVWLKPRNDKKSRWRFWFSNTVDSTFGDGEVAYANQSGGEYSILWATISTAKNLFDLLEQTTELTFDDNKTKNVMPNERFWSDEAELLTKGYLVFTWCIKAKKGVYSVPCTPDSQAPCFKVSGNVKDLSSEKFSISTECPIPSLVATYDEKTTRLGFLGDSITQGCQTTPNEYGFWVAKIANGLSKDKYSVWNLGLGCGRANDAVTDLAWLYKAKKCDELCICMGVNDILAGKRTADEICSDIFKIISILKNDNQSRRITLFTIPTFDFCDEDEKTWRGVNKKIREGYFKQADRIFDIARVVSCDEPNDRIAKYGPHPNDNGGTEIAKNFLLEFDK